MIPNRPESGELRDDGMYCPKCGEMMQFEVARVVASDNAYGKDADGGGGSDHPACWRCTECGHIEEDDDDIDTGEW